MDDKPFTRIGQSWLPIVNFRYPTIVTFGSGELGKSERGEFLFWTVMLKRKITWQGRKRWWLIARARAILYPGERFNRMRTEARTAGSIEDRKIYYDIYNRMLKRGQNVKYIRPSTAKELQRWMDSHINDACYVQRVVVKGQQAELLPHVFRQIKKAA